MDPNNPVVRLCTEGMQAEFAGKMIEAKQLFLQAWEASQDDFDACVAAHYVARHQETPQEMLRWNVIALERADATGDERVKPFYPSLYLNIGYCWENLGEREKATQYYRLAEERVGDVPEGGYGDVLREGIANGLKRTGACH